MTDRIPKLDSRFVRISRMRIQYLNTEWRVYAGNPYIYITDFLKNMSWYLEGESVPMKEYR